MERKNLSFDGLFARTLGGIVCAAVAGMSVNSLAQADALCGCAGDFDNNGFVNAADLSLLLGAWGSSNDAYDLNGDGTVNAADLSVVLGAWGPCGAPSNDTCGGAAQLPVSYDLAVPFCTLNAETDGPVEPTCDPSGNGYIFNDVWYLVTAPAAGTLVVDTCDANFDTRLAVYAPDVFGSHCPGFIFGSYIIGCNDDVGSNDVLCSNILSSRVSVPVSSGVTYTIRVGGYNGAIGTGTLGIHFHPKGDLCSDAIPVSLVDPGDGDGVTVILNGNTDHATASTPIANLTSCGGTGDTKDLWFKVTVDCASGTGQPVDFTATTCMPGTDFDTTLAIYVGSCDGMTELDCNDDFDSSNCVISGFNRKSLVGISPTNDVDTYYVRLAGYNGATGQYQIKFHFKCLNF